MTLEATRTQLRLHSESMELLKQFATPSEVGVACFHAFGQAKHFAVPAWIVDFVRAGYVEICRPIDPRPDDPIVDSPRVYFRTLVLTTLGFDACGIPRRDGIDNSTRKPQREVPTLF